MLYMRGAIGIEEKHNYDNNQHIQLDWKLVPTPNSNILLRGTELGFSQ